MKNILNSDIVCILCGAMHSNNINCQRNGGMINIYPEFYTKAIKQYISDLIYEYGYQHYQDLSQADKAKFTSLLIDASKEGEFESITQSAHSDITIEFFKSALVDSKWNEEFIETIKGNAIDYYESIMNALFNDLLGDYRQERNEWVDYVAKQTDPDMAYEQYRNSL